jgi:hypothetical protein
MAPFPLIDVQRLSPDQVFAGQGLAKPKEAARVPAARIWQNRCNVWH